MNENRKCAPLNLKALRKPVCVSILQLRVKANLLYIINDPKPNIGCLPNQGWAKLVLIALERYSVALKRLTFNLR
jgi:hypothetical protein